MTFDRFRDEMCTAELEDISHFIELRQEMATFGHDLCRHCQISLPEMSVPLPPIRVSTLPVRSPFGATRTAEPTPFRPARTPSPQVVPPARPTAIPARVTVSKWICRDPSSIGLSSDLICDVPLRNCDACNNENSYASIIDAVSHLTRVHFDEEAARDNVMTSSTRSGNSNGGILGRFAYEYTKWVVQVKA